jgi:ribonuclease P protein subunit RPR2
MKKSTVKQLAIQRVRNLIDTALYSSDEFAQDHIKIARKIISKYKLKVPFEYKILFCKNCKKYIVPGKDSRIRIGRSNTKALRITCKFCNHTYRKIIEKSIAKSNSGKTRVRPKLKSELTSNSKPEQDNKP